MSQNCNISKQYCFDKKLYDKHALNVVEVLQKNGFEAYFVGGCVRDMLLGYKPKDFDVLTNARPKAIIRLFKHARIIGRRFPIVHVGFGKHFVETTSWYTEKDSFWRRLISSKIKGSLHEDALRRDFTANAIYLDPCKNILYDPLDGHKHILDKKLCMIGNPFERLKEDPLRVLRAIRLASKTSLILNEELKKSLPDLVENVVNENSQRIYLEWVKILLSGLSLSAFELFLSTKTLKVLPYVDEVLQNKQVSLMAKNMLNYSFASVDQRVKDEKSVSLVFAFAVLFWPAVSDKLYKSRSEPDNDKIEDILNEVSYPLKLPVKIREGVIEIYSLQYQMQNKSSKNVLKLMNHMRFRAGYDFLMLRAMGYYKVIPLASWWFDFVNGSQLDRAYMLLDQDAKSNSFRNKKPRPKFKKRR